MQKNKAEEKIKKAEEESNRMKQALLDELELAARDLVLSLEKRVLELFKNVLEEKLNTSFTKDPVYFIRTIFHKWQSSVQGWKICLSKQDSEKLTEELLAALQKKIKEGIEIQIDPEIKAGFKVMVKDGSYYLDFTAGTMAELLMERVSPVLQRVLRKVKEQKMNEP